MAKGITIIGLGPGDPGLLTQRAADALGDAEEIYLRTSHLPGLADYPLPDEIHSFDQLYETMDSAPEVYEAIVATILEKARRPQGVVYAVPGDPSVGEATVSALRHAAAEMGLGCVVHPGLSFLEPTLNLLQIDALDGLMIADALEIAASFHPGFPPDLPVLIGQLHSQLLASDLKLTLLNQYPPDHGVVLIQGAGTDKAASHEFQLRDLDTADRFDHMSSLLVPAMDAHGSFESFQNTVAHLRSPVGCPWDREQTHLSLRQHLMEEAYEALDALDREDTEALREELGDLMLQLVLQTQIATEAGDFLMADVLRDINDKLIRRHPHVFGEVDVDDVDEVLHNWESLKADERAEGAKGAGALKGVPRQLPALAMALEYQARAARLGFDWPRVEGVLDKIGEELEELSAAAGARERSAEMGDLLFALVNYARWEEIDPEAALRSANGRFFRRFSWIEEQIAAKGQALAELSLDEIEALWQQAKGEVT